MNQTDGFNLASTPWVPVRNRDGTAGRLSLERAVIDAHQFSAIAHPSPSVTLSLHRLVLATIYAAYRGPDRMSQVAKLLDSGRFDPDVVRTYFAEHKHEFFLFGSRPFMQDPSLKLEHAKDREQPLDIQQLLRESSAPGGPTLFDHTLPGTRSLSLEEAACHLVTEQLFALQDGRGYGQSPISSGVASFAVGDTLFETLVLNLLPYNSNQPIKATNFARDTPFWEQNRQTAGAIPNGWLDYLTRPYRRLLLVGTEDAVTGVYRKAGTLLDTAWRQANQDPWLAYVVRDTGTFPVLLKADKALWRDSHVLMQRLRTVGNTQPGWFDMLRRIGSAAAITVVGAAADSNAVRLWREERIPVNASLLTDDDAFAALESALAASEQAARAIRSSCELMLTEATEPRSETASRSPCSRKPTKTAKALAPALGATERYWSRVGSAFPRLMVDIPQGSDAALSAWSLALGRAARDSFDGAAEAVATNQRGFRAAAIARNCFHGRLAAALAPLSSDQAPVQEVVP